MKDNLGNKFSQFLESLGIKVIDCTPKKTKCEFKDAVTGKRLSGDCPICRKYKKVKK